MTGRPGHTTREIHHGVRSPEDGAVRHQNGAVTSCVTESGVAMFARPQVFDQEAALAIAQRFIDQRGQLCIRQV
jgi:hypothetical protein